ncbi:MAG TPA: NUDIX domain-containing protein [Stackebrandtia sp.]|uniref:NUDIX hydrolase n=1 Tax=Stackebrandtia sp. TaxID=2023065 RepID=UPI002D324A5D|nr:NUDIX domain-containing protein [Stackebrandtia sp.]HZE39059.1 NUDIX domain-containing protein [Stackebrandtia sp.]
MSAPAGVPVHDRRASRVLVVDGDDRVLLFRGCDPAEPEEKFWFSAGGGLDDGEDERDAACRELMEETGIRAVPDDLAGPVHREIAEFGFDGVWIRQHQVFYVLRVADNRVDTSGFEELEVATMDQHHWWSLAELEATSEVIFPDNLVALLRDIRCGTS